MFPYKFGILNRFPSTVEYTSICSPLTRYVKSKHILSYYKKRFGVVPVKTNIGFATAQAKKETTNRNTKGDNCLLNTAKHQQGKTKIFSPHAWCASTNETCQTGICDKVWAKARRAEVELFHVYVKLKVCFGNLAFHTYSHTSGRTVRVAKASHVSFGGFSLCNFQAFCTTIRAQPQYPL